MVSECSVLVWLAHACLPFNSLQAPNMHTGLLRPSTRTTLRLLSPTLLPIHLHSLHAPLATHPPFVAPQMCCAELKALDFGNNSMGKQGAYALADLLRGSTSVTDVNINMNDVGDDGAFQVGLGGVGCVCVCV